jgi:hypothetical protein
MKKLYFTYRHLLEDYCSIYKIYSIDVPTNHTRHALDGTIIKLKTIEKNLVVLLDLAEIYTRNSGNGLLQKFTLFCKHRKALDEVSPEVDCVS